MYVKNSYSILLQDKNGPIVLFRTDHFRIRTSSVDD